jgi:hypothetical protein
MEGWGRLIFAAFLGLSVLAFLLLQWFSHCKQAGEKDKEKYHDSISSDQRGARGIR